MSNNLFKHLKRIITTEETIKATPYGEHTKLIFSGGDATEEVILEYPHPRVNALVQLLRSPTLFDSVGGDFARQDTECVQLVEYIVKQLWEGNHMRYFHDAISEVFTLYNTLRSGNYGLKEYKDIHLVKTNETPPQYVLMNGSVVSLGSACELLIEVYCMGLIGGGVNE